MATIQRSASKTADGGTNRKNGWKQDPQRVKADILATSTTVFAANGFAGTRIDEIVRRTSTSKRMIYYYFGDKKGLYQEVLEAAYAKVRDGESKLSLADMDPVSALRKLVEFTFDFHRNNPVYVQLVQSENINNAANLKKSKKISDINHSALNKLEIICLQGLQEGSFRTDITPTKLHWLITSACFFNVANRATFQQIHGDKLFKPKGQKELRQLVVDSVLLTVTLQ